MKRKTVALSALFATGVATALTIATDNPVMRKLTKDTYNNVLVQKNKDGISGDIFLRSSDGKEVERFQRYFKIANPEVAMQIRNSNATCNFKATGFYVHKMDGAILKPTIQEATCRDLTEIEKMAIKQMRAQRPANPGEVYDVKWGRFETNSFTPGAADLK